MTEENEYDVESDDSECPYCGKDLSTELVENRRLIVGHPCKEKDREVEVCILNNPEAIDFEQALEHLREAEYAQALRYIPKDEEMELYAEIESLSEFVGDFTDGMIGGKLGQVVSNYGDRIMDDLARKAAEADTE